MAEILSQRARLPLAGSVPAGLDHEISMSRKWRLDALAWKTKNRGKLKGCDEYWQAEAPDKTSIADIGYVKLPQGFAFSSGSNCRRVSYDLE